jgi:hypothetical protein
MSTVDGSPSIIRDNLIYYLDGANRYSYTSGSTIWNDLSKSQRTGGSLINGVSYSTTNKGVLVFDGINDYVALPQITTNQTEGKYSMELWISFANTITPSNAINYMIIEAQNLLLGGVDNYIYLLSSTAGRIGFQTFNPFVVTYTTTNNWVAGRWYNITGTYDISTSKLSLYVNGVLESFTTIANCYFNTNTYFSLGSYSAPAKSWFFNGSIASLKIYNKTLTDSEILENYNVNRYRFNF